MGISAQQVKELREMTGAGMMDCKKALVESDGNLDAALEFLQTKGMAAAAKKAGRIAAEGLIAQWIADDHKSAVIVEINCETDFVSRNEQFQEFVAAVTNAIGASSVNSVEEAADLQVNGKSLTDFASEAVSSIGEKVTVRRMVRLSEPEGFITGYMHPGDQLGVMLKVKGNSSDDEKGFGRDVAMHIAAMNPTYLTTSDISPDAASQQEALFEAIVAEEGKPAEIVPKIVAGKMAKWRKEQSLLEQPFVKDSDLSIAQLQDKVGGVQIVEFIRFAVGDGIEKKESNLAEEVAATLKN